MGNDTIPLLNTQTKTGQHCPPDNLPSKREHVFISISSYFVDCEHLGSHIALGHRVFLIFRKFPTFLLLLHLRHFHRFGC